MFPGFHTLEVTVCGGNLDSVQDVENEVMTHSSVHDVDAAVPFPAAEGRPVTLAPVLGWLPPSLPGKEEYSSSQVEKLGVPVPPGDVPVPVDAGAVVELVYQGVLWECGIPVPVPPDPGPEAVPITPVVKTPEDRDDGGAPVSMPEEPCPDPV